MSSSAPSTTLLPRNIFVPEQYPFVNPVVLSPFEKLYIKLILQLSEKYIAQNMMNLVIAGWYNVTFDNYPSLRMLLPASYPDTIVGLAQQVTMAIQNLRSDSDAPLREQFTPIGRRHYMHGAEAVTLLCSSPCLVQSMYNVLTSTVESIVRLLEGLHDYPNLLMDPLKASGHLPESQDTGLRGIAEDSPPRLTSEEASLLGSLSPGGAFGKVAPGVGASKTRAPQGSALRGLAAEDPEIVDPPEDDAKLYGPVVSILMMDPRSVTLGEAVPAYLVERVLKTGLADTITVADTSQPVGLTLAEQPGPPDLVERLFAAVRGLPPELQTLLLGSLDQSVVQVVKDLLDGKLDLGSLAKSVIDTIIQYIVAFVLRYVIPVLLIPFGRFVDCMVDIITDGVRTERAVRLLASWEAHLQPRAEELARRFWWKLLEITPDVRFSLGLETGPQLELRLDELTAQLAYGLTVNFPRILDGGMDFKQALKDMGKRWKEAGFPIDGYDGVRLAFLATVDAMLFSASPVYARSLPATRLKEAYSQLVSVVITELVYGAGGNSFKPVGGILGLPMPGPA